MNIEILKLHIESGVDEFINDEPTNFFADKKMVEKTKDVNAVEPLKEEKTVVVSKEAPPISNNISAKSVANKCNTVEELKQAVLDFEGCGLKKFATNTVFGDGDYKSGVMLIGEAPGKNEDLSGIPFCGASGKLLDLMLNAIDLDRTKSYITNTIFWRPPGNRKPTPEETAICSPFVEKHIALVNPKVLILVGGTAVSTVLDTTEGISKLVGKPFTYTNDYLDRDIPVRVIYHPSYLLRQPGQKRFAWRALLEIKDFLENIKNNK